MQQNQFASLLIWIPLIIFMYLIFLLPQQRRRKKEDAMRLGVQIGDEITTIGGIIGKVVSIKNETDSLIIETGTDKSRVQIRRWAIAANNSVADEEPKKDKKDKKDKE